MLCGIGMFAIVPAEFAENLDVCPDAGKEDALMPSESTLRLYAAEGSEMSVAGIAIYSISASVSSRTDNSDNDEDATGDTPSVRTRLEKPLAMPQKHVKASDMYVAHGDRRVEIVGPPARHVRRRAT